MKTEQEVNDFKAEAAKQVYDCSICDGALDSKCACTASFLFEMEAFEACIPRDFWHVAASDVEFNVNAFRQFVLPYVHRIAKAHRHGYGLLLSGSNGVGKSMFMSFVLTQAIRRGRSAYYTSMLQLDHDIKRGFRDQDAQRRLEWLLTSDFLGLDEMGKEQFKSIDQPNFIKTQIERILKQRFDESKPVLLATNLSASALGKTYGDTIASIINGKYQSVAMEPGDIRRRLAAKMAKDMGY
jgi:DNA replication protein DnaC